MGVFKVRRSAIIVGGSVQMGADVNLYRSAANTLKTDDSLVVGGATMTLPYGTTSPTLSTDGNFVIYHKSNVPRIALRSGGTIYTMTLVNQATATYTAGTAAP